MARALFSIMLRPPAVSLCEGTPAFLPDGLGYTISVSGLVGK